MNKMLTSKLGVITGLVSGLLFGLLLVQTVSAATTKSGSESITLSPTNKHYTLDPGTVHQDKITIVNDGDTDYDFTVFAQPYSVNDEKYEPDFYTVRENTDLKSWIEFAQKKYSIKSGQSVTVPYTITVPENAIPGGHYGVIFAETQPSGKPDGTAIQRKSRVGALVYATVNGAFKTGGNFQAIRIPGLQFKAPIRGEITVQNTGDTDFATTTVFAVDDLFGSRKYSETKDYQVLPQTKRTIPLQWEKSPGFGFYKVTISAKFLDKQTTKTAYVLMAPIAFYMVFAVGLLIGVIYFVQKRR